MVGLPTELAGVPDRLGHYRTRLVPANGMEPRAGDGARTHDPQLGKLMLYQLSYAREAGSVAIYGMVT